MRGRRGSVWRFGLVCMFVVASVVLGVSQRSYAGHVNFNLGIGIPLPGVVAAPPVVVTPALIYAAPPPPVVVEAAPVVVAPAYGTYYYGHRPYYRPYHYHHRYHHRPY